MVGPRYWLKTSAIHLVFTEYSLNLFLNVHLDRSEISNRKQYEFPKKVNEIMKLF